MVFNIERLRFRTRILLGFAIILVISLISSTISIIQVNSIGDKSNLIYKHPFKVTNAIRDINACLNSMHVTLNMSIHEENLQDIDSIAKEFPNYKDKFEEAYSVLSSQYLGKKSSVIDSKEAFYKCYNLGEKAVNLKKQGLNIQGQVIVTFNFTIAKKDLLKKNKILSDFATKKADSLFYSIKEKRKKSLIQLKITIITLFILSLIVVMYLSRNISKPLINFISKSRKIIQDEISNGIDINKLSEENLLKFVDDELSRIYKENKAVLKATMENSHAGIAIADAPSGKIRYVNRLGRTIGKKNNLDIQKVINNYEKNDYKNILKRNKSPYKFNELPHMKAIIEGKNISEEILLNLDNNEERYLWANAAPIYNNKNEINSSILIFLDITEQKHTLKNLQIQNKKYEVLTTEYKKQNEELAKAKLKAEEINKLKSSFMATMSHELRTPLNTIIGLSELIDSDMSISEIVEMTNLINKNGNQLLDIIESILQLTLLQAGESRRKDEIFSISEFCSELKFIFKSELKTRNKEHIKAAFYYDSSNKDKMLNTDKYKLGILLKHAYINSIKFTEEGEIECIYYIEDKDVIFKIKDTGAGIDKKLIDVIFEKFRQADNSNTRKFGGIGMGLATCKEIANLLGGEIHIDSEKNEGTTFIFRLKNVVV